MNVAANMSLTTVGSLPRGIETKFRDKNIFKIYNLLN
jgi:hypothetical protein